MKKRIIYFVQQYNPKYEAISKEVECLHSTFNSLIFNPQGKKLNFRKDYISFNFRRMPPALILLPFIRARYNIGHIYTSLGNKFYLSMLRKRPLLLTAAGASEEDKIDYCLRYYPKLSHIIVESERDKELLFSKGIDDSKISLIYPGLDLDKFHYCKPKGKSFKILFASSAMQETQFHAKGINFLVKNSDAVNNVNYTFLWRNMYESRIKSLVKGKNIEIITGQQNNMAEQYDAMQATIFSPATYLNTKPCPHSLMESLASGKPVAVSVHSGIAPLIKKERCGVVFETEKESFTRAIEFLIKNYGQLQSKARTTAEKYFSKEKFIKQYAHIYGDLK